METRPPSPSPGPQFGEARERRHARCRRACPSAQRVEHHIMGDEVEGHHRGYAGAVGGVSDTIVSKTVYFI